MKKLLAMVLALVMTLSLAVSANAFKDDKSISDDYAEAVAVLNGMGVFKGYEDGSFQPKGNITRAEVSAIVYRVYTQDVKDAKASMYATYNKFSDMAGAGWAQGYIGYCANAELVKGYPDGTFKPSGKVTGYEVLAMILRAVGYDKNGEFSGADWALHVAQTAQQAGVLKNVKGIDLNAPATRELVAELLFRAIADASTVNYTPAFGYVTDKVLKLDESTLGYKNFKLVGTASSDDWGRPATKWTYNVGDKETLVVDKPVVSYTTKVAECDIAKDLGISSAKNLEKAYIDGSEKGTTDFAVTTNRFGTINPLATTSYVGAQGRITEVYAMDNSTYRIVEINTYLAKVNKVTAAKTDRNGHTTDATVDLTVFLTDGTGVSFTGVKAEGFTVDQYVLVTVLKADKYSTTAALNKASVKSIVAAEVVAGGKLTGWTDEVGTTAATSVVGATTYNDANKFFLNRRAAGNNWLVALDAYGNAIGLVESASNYLAVARIEWKANTNSFGGYALADVVLANGEVKNDVTVASVGDKAANAAGSTAGTYTAGNVDTGSISIWWENNAEYYKHIMAYSVNADGSYNLMDLSKNHYNPSVATSEKIVDLGGTAATGTAYYNSGNATIGDQTNTIVATNETVFLYLNENGYSYTVYTGKDNAPSIEEAKMCVKFDGSGYAEFVIVREFASASDTFMAYVTDAVEDGYAYPTAGQTPVYNVYKMGEVSATTVKAAVTGGNTIKNNVFTQSFATHKSGLYEIKVSDGYVVSMTPVVCDGSDGTCTDSYSNTAKHIDRLKVKESEKAGSIQFKDYGAGQVAKDFNLKDTKVIKVVTYTLNGTSYTYLEEGSTADLTVDKTVLVNYSATATSISGYEKYDAKTIYVMVAGDKQNADADNAAPELTAVYNQLNSRLYATLKSGTPSQVNETTTLYVSVKHEQGEWSTPITMEWDKVESPKVNGVDFYSADLGINGSGNYYINIIAKTNGVQIAEYNMTLTK